MRNRIVKQLLMCCMGISLVVGTPVVGWASETETTEETSEEETSETISGSEEDVYQEAYEYASEKYDYTKAAELLRTIENYKDSKELADRYEQMGTNRFIDGRFYWYPEEYVLVLKQNLQALNDNYTNISITGGEVTPEEGSSINITIEYNDGETEVILHDIDYDENAKSESFGSVEVKSENGSLFAYPILIVTSTARGDSTIENAQDILPRLLDLDPHGQIVQDGLVYTFDHQNSILSVLIEGEEKNSDAVEIDSQLEIDDSNINVTDNSDNGEENNELYDEILSGYQELRENLKDPDSIKIQGVQLTSDKDIVFKYTATNGFGGRVTEYSIYKGRGHLVSNDVASLYWRNYNESVNWNDVVQYSKSSAYTGGVVVIENN